MLVPSSPAIPPAGLPPLWNDSANSTVKRAETGGIAVPSFSPGDTDEPMWDDSAFSIPDDDIAHAYRQRRNVLGRLGDMFGAWYPRPRRPGPVQAELALARIGQMLWDIRRGRASIDGRARRLRLESLQALGGRKSLRGQEFDRRYHAIGRFVRRAGVRLERELRQVSEPFASVVRDEMDFAMGLAWRYLIHGRPVPRQLFDEAARQIQCRIRWLEQRWTLNHLYWLWARFAC
ncbi:hypothetical protein GT347_06045 [Xylophilus rhododendri]|uniref:Uncharacterized protein n=1 Tax=Xylophilus rhododendri TaxID=2697032 RepID=A0A857J1V4_9BURK|nr:hypothetical protein [Xylophilus rhododendri]QHI97587.1 hypothetical protein GT347_06045 [Xylophilus rhododendri]